MPYIYLVYMCVVFRRKCKWLSQSSVLKSNNPDDSGYEFQMFTQLVLLN